MNTSAGTIIVWTRLCIVVSTSLKRAGQEGNEQVVMDNAVPRSLLCARTY